MAEVNTLVEDFRDMDEETFKKVSFSFHVL